MSVWRRLTVFLLPFAVSDAVADEVLYQYEGDVFPYDDSAGWVICDPCDDACTESLQDGRYVTEYVGGGDGWYNYDYLIDGTGGPPPPTPLWIEWRHRSNHPKPPYACSGNATFKVRYGEMYEPVNLFGDAAFSFSCADGIVGLDINEFHTYRFESLDGVFYRISVDGETFIDRYDDQPAGPTYLQLGSLGACGAEYLPVVNEWDFVRFGTISYGERIVATDPPRGFLDARQHADLDRFTVTFDSPNYVYIDDITVEVAGRSVPAVIQTRRRENDGPHTVEVVLDRPMPMAQRTRFTFYDGVVLNIVEYAFAPGDTDGDGDKDLADVAAFQNCFGHTDLVGACQALDLTLDEGVNADDYAVFSGILAGPGA